MMCDVPYDPLPESVLSCLTVTIRDLQDSLLRWLQRKLAPAAGQPPTHVLCRIAAAGPAGCSSTSKRSIIPSLGPKVCSHVNRLPVALFQRISRCFAQCPCAPSWASWQGFLAHCSALHALRTEQCSCSRDFIQKEGIRRCCMQSSHNGLTLPIPGACAPQGY